MKWIEIALKYCYYQLNFITAVNWNKKEAIFNVKYEVVLRNPYSKARWGGGDQPLQFVQK